LEFRRVLFRSRAWRPSGGASAARGARRLLRDRLASHRLARPRRSRPTRERELVAKKRDSPPFRGGRGKEGLSLFFSRTREWGGPREVGAAPRFAARTGGRVQAAAERCRASSGQLCGYWLRSIHGRASPKSRPIDCMISRARFIRALRSVNGLA